MQLSGNLVRVGQVAGKHLIRIVDAHLDEKSAQLPCHLGGALIPIGGGAGERLVHDSRKVLADGGAQTKRVRVLAFEQKLQQVMWIAANERQAARRAKVEHRPQ